ncbi:MAG: amino acid adenylation domain-containing protein, partial [Blastocatellia bacterium]|nr:amino acid adenylation domain-containing protein [Blastocatellia bacterium]
MPETHLEGFHLSPQQKRIWELQESELVTPYRTYCVVSIDGHLDIQLLRAAIQDTINRHEILRTTFHRSPSLSFPLQVISPEMPHHFTYHDMDKVPLQDRESFKMDLIERACNAEIDFEVGPLFKQSLLSLSPTSHVLILTLAAVCCDAASLNNLFKEITNSYAARKRSETFSPESMQYADLAEWQNELLVAEETQAGRDYWEKQDLSDLLSPRLQIEKEPSGEPHFHPDIQLTRIDSEIAVYIDRSADEFGTTPSCVLLACWQALLNRAALTDDLTIYAAFNGRKWEETECALGLFARHLPVRCRFDSSMKFSDLLEATDRVVNAIYTWQEYFTWDRLGPDFNPISFDYHERQAPFTLDDVSFSITDQYACIDRFKLKLSCIRQEGHLISEFHFNKQFFSEAMIARLASQFHTMLGSITANSGCAIGELDIVSEEETDYFIQGFNDARGDHSISRCVHKLFEEQVVLHSDNTAVVFEQERITYGELNTKANRLARYLQRAGVVPDSVVGLYLDRSIEMILGMISILKAGGAYVVLDPALPKERLRFILDDTRSSLVVTQKSLSKPFSDHQARAICTDEDWKFIAEESPDEPVSDVRPENLVYIIYTSGSTGVPKGVAVEHRHLLNYLNGAIERLEILPQSSFATVSTFAADLGNTAIYPALCTGGCLHIISQQRAYDPLALGDYISANSIDCLKIVPSHLKALLTVENPHRLIPRKRLVLGGEACDGDFVADLKKLAPHCLIFNHYGPTETTVGVLVHRIEDQEADSASQAVPLGRPLRNVSVYVLNRFLKPEPTGYRGELCISGGSVTRGYLNRPDLTAESFMPDPFSPEPGARLYKTGDMARFLSGGSLEFLGRNDEQVKVRGFRIELGEVEAAIEQHEAVREAVVIVKNHEGEKRLIACVASNQPHSQAASEIADSLRAKLPEYMIPYAILLFDRLPLNKNGKIDRQALLRIDPAEHETKKGYTAPRTSVEKRLAEVWASVLGVSRVGIHDNFFELGGDSIIGIRLIARARQAGIRLAPAHIFQYPTIAELASLQGSGTEIESDQQTVTGLLPLTPIQHWFFHQDLPD